MFLRGARRRREAEELRAKFVANRDKVRAWQERWDCPEVEWPPFTETPFPHVVAPWDLADWLERRAPHLVRYEWLLEARPVARGVGELIGHWEFGAGHRFEQLRIRFRSVLDPDYLAEKLALGIRAAGLKGWREEDVQGLYDWLHEGVSSLVGTGMVHGRHRTGFVMNDLTCAAVSRTEVITEVRSTLTDTAMDGTPLKPDGSF
ncbi:hypothetical protein ABZZ79_30635 [Streptomyces sp. NPDC006458]|uniref:hypothetical protein n=1 Tax=Streptomyces sp. NPDC006458 TaxID=3154302 RepID=UPI0033BEC551